MATEEDATVRAGTIAAPTEREFAPQIDTHIALVGAGFAILHHKLWVVDGETLFSGSVNPTHHGLTCNDAHLLESSTWEP